MASTLDAENINEYAMYCLLNAPNSFELLMVAFDIYIHPEASDNVRNRTFQILSSIVTHLHHVIYESRNQRARTPPILDLIKNNIGTFIDNSVKSSNALRRLQIRILQLLCIHYGHSFTAETFHNILNSELESPVTISPSPSPLLSPLLKALKLQMGAEVYECLTQMIKLNCDKKLCFWSQLYVAVTNDEVIYLDIDQLSNYVREYDVFDNYHYSYFILHLIMHMMEKFPKKISKANYRMCATMVTYYFDLVCLQQNCLSENVDIIMNLIVTTQKCMGFLSTSDPTNQQILSRLLLELTLRNDFCNERVFNDQCLDSSSVKVNLLKENSSIETNHSYKFRKIALLPRNTNAKKNGFKNNIFYSINQQLVLDAFRCCVTDMQAFAKLLVECSTPDVLFNDVPWPDEEYLKVSKSFFLIFFYSLCD